MFLESRAYRVVRALASRFPCNRAMISIMKTSRERILLVENDPEISDIIARQTLQTLDYRVDITRSAGSAIQEAARLSPDLILAELDLPGLSGKDLIVALSSQGVEVPVIIIANKGMEADVIQAFRLGASDYLLWPAREAEIVSAVERVLKQVRLHRERETLARQLKQTNDELHQRVRELTTIFALGKGITSITNQRSLLDKIVEGALYVTEAESGWLLLKDERSKKFLLSAQRNLPPKIAEKLNQPWDDGISSLVALSGETLSIHGEPLARFKVSQLGKSALVTPIKVKKEIIGLLVVVRKAPRPFSSSNKTLLEAVADYASISLVNARSFRVSEERARSLQETVENAKANERRKEQFLKNLQRELNKPLRGAIDMLNSLLVGENSRLNATQKGVLRSTQEKLKQAAEIVEAIKTLH
jgi:two-component system NtrC family sensor kinase